MIALDEQREGMCDVTEDEQDEEVHDGENQDDHEAGRPHSVDPLLHSHPAANIGNCFSLGT